jgi:hypothetical protein
MHVMISAPVLLVLLVAVVSACNAQPEDRVPADTTARAAPPRATAQLPLVDSGAPTLPPSDEADASFRSFRTTTLAALSARDTAYLYSILAPDIKNSFGGDDSIAGFKRIWRMAEGGTEVWDALSRVLRMGGALQGDSAFIAPYVYAFWPDSIDAFEHVAVVAANAPVRDEPSQATPPTGRLSHSIVRIEDWQSLGESGVASDSTWARVRLPGGRSGWVRGLDVYSPVSWRAFFARRNGRWILQLFVAGD